MQTIHIQEEMSQVFETGGVLCPALASYSCGETDSYQTKGDRKSTIGTLFEVPKALRSRSEGVEGGGLGRGIPPQPTRRSEGAS